MRFLSLLVLPAAATLMLRVPNVGAQTTPANQSLSAPAGSPENRNPPPPASPAAVTPPAADDSTLEVAPRIIPIVPSPEEQAPGEGETADIPEATPLSIAPSAHGRPYLGISVQPALVRFHRQDIHGLEIIGVDKGSPAERAGFTAPTGKTTVGATGETASFFLGPVGGLLMSPLLARSGQLGATGDMIVAVDDQRVSIAPEMNRVLARLAPGDKVWFTLMRITPEGKVKNEKIPVVLGSADGAAPSTAPPAAGANH